jgi:hypothetical protein
MPVSPLTAQPTAVAPLRKFASGGYLYALMDAYDSPAVPAKAQEMGKERAVSLFLGEAEKKYWDLAPYLIQVDETTLDWVFDKLWKAPWGVFVLSKTGIESLRTHFRRFLIVQLPDGERWFFRYYDPRILNIYLANCVSEELEIFFGPVRAFGIPDSDCDRVLLLHTGAEVHAPVARPQTAASPVWKVRQEQFEALDMATRTDLEVHLVRHLQNRFPQHCKALGGPGTYEFIRHGVSKAATYQITRSSDLAPFIELMFLLGRDFEQNTRFPWAQTILQDPLCQDPEARIARLFEAAQDMLGQTTRNGTTGP